MLRGTLVTVGVGLGVWLVACSGSSSGGTSTSPESACAGLVQAVCGRLEECFPIAIRASYKDVAQCKERQTSSCLKIFNAPGSTVTPEKADACTSGYNALSCEALLAGSSPEACRFAGTLTDGTPCGDGAQCTGRNCRKTGGNTCGACSTRGAAGATCQASGDCLDELTCAGGKCVAPAKAGAACSTNQPCEASLRCANGTCAQPLAAGTTCESGANDACDRLKGFFCDPTAKVCKEVKFANAGEACGLVNGTFVACAAAGHCKTGANGQGTCQAAAADGQPCDTKNGPSCIEPADCVNGVCTLPDPAACK